MNLNVFSLRYHAGMRRWAPVVLATFVLILLTIVFVHTGPAVPVPFRERFSPDGTPIMFESINNSTLGTEKVLYVNMPNRFNKLDVMTMQSAVSGVSFDVRPGVFPDELEAKGLPPNSNSYKHKHDMTPTEKACFRAHVNIWREMVEKNWQSVLVLESDATWDVRLKDNLQRTARALNDLTVLYPGYEKRTEPSENDPYNIGQWDFFYVGSCLDNGHELRKDQHLIYPDPGAPRDFYYWGRTLQDERLVRRSGAPICTTGYIVSQAGARKMLLHTNLDMSQAIDELISNLSRNNLIVSYAVYPPIIQSWEYVEAIGADDKNSDIRTEEGTDASAEAWTQAFEEMSVWRTRWHGLYKVQNPVLRTLKDAFFGEQIVENEIVHVDFAPEPKEKSKEEKGKDEGKDEGKDDKGKKGKE